MYVAYRMAPMAAAELLVAIAVVFSVQFAVLEL